VRPCPAGDVITGQFFASIGHSARHCGRCCTRLGAEEHLYLQTKQ
jgi:hypothetical protein